MKSRTPSRTAFHGGSAVGHGRFRFHPLSVAVCLAFSGAALALPQGGTVVAGQATITRPGPTTQVITQSSDRAIIDWRSFSIAAGERVRFYQPSSTSVTLNRVTGYDPSYILGQMSSNGRIFLLNPYGVVFGAGARIDVGGMVASSLSLASNDFLAGRYSLTSQGAGAPAQRGAVRNEGVINAPGGTVALVAPVVSNTGTITADRGRVGLAAVNQVSVDVEGDGLVFFQASASEARNRLEQLGRIQADGGTVELRAAARGAFADTVLNMSGVVQARAIGTREGRIVIDGGSDGVVRVAGTVDVSGRGASERGGSAVVQGGAILLDDGTRIDAAGDAGGGAVRVGGGFHGSDASVRNAVNTSVAADVRIDADALTRGDGGTVAVWADGLTVFRGDITARGGATSGDGGFVEVSGKGALAFLGAVDTRASHGATGTLLLDPTDITISNAASDAGQQNAVAAGTDTVTFTSVTPSNLNTASLVTLLGANNVVIDTASALAGAGTITVVDPIAWANARNLTLRADSTITVNAAISNTGTGSLALNTDAAVALNAAVNLAGGSFTVADRAGSGRAASFTSGGGGTITTTGPNGAVLSAMPGGAVTISTVGDLATVAITARGGDGTGGFGPGNGGAVALTTSNGAITTGAIDTRGGTGVPSDATTAGGTGGSVTLTVGAGSHALNAGTITTRGGRGLDEALPNLTGGAGGAGGVVTVTNSSAGNTTLAAIDTRGGVGGDGTLGSSDGGVGGPGGAITVVSSSGTLAVAAIIGSGGAGGAASGAGTVGGTGANSAVSLNFGQVATGTLDLSGNTIVGANVTATGGAAADTILVTGGVGENITLATALLTRPTAGNVALAGIENATVTTGTGTTNVAAWGGTATVQLTAGAGTVTGNGVGTTLQALAGGTNFTVNAASGGTAGGTTFVTVGNLRGGAGADNFTVSGAGTLGGAIDGGGGVNSLSVTTAAADFVLASASSGTATGVTGGYSNVTTLAGNGTTSTLTGTNTASTFSVTGNNAGTVNDGVGTTTFSAIANLVGGSAADAFAIAAGAALASIDGGAGANTLTATAAAGGNITLTNALLTRTGPLLTTTLAGIGGATLVGEAGNNAIDGSAFTGALGLTVSGGTDVLTGNGALTTIVAAAGGTTFIVDSANGGTANAGATTFSGATSLAGAAGIDTFRITTGTLAGNITGAGGNDTLDLAARVGAITINQGGTIGGSGVAGTISGVNVVGNGATTTFIGTNSAQTYTIGSPDSVTVGGQTFSGVGSVAGGTAADVFVVSAGASLSGALDGGTGAANTLDISALATANFTLTSATSGTANGIGGGYSNVGTLVGNVLVSTLTGTNTGSTYAVSGANAGTVNDGIGTTTFSGVSNLAGGTGADSFVIANAGSLAGTINGGAGAVNTLDLSARGTAAFALSSAAAGTASGVAGGYSNVATLVGNAAVSTLTGTNTGSTYAVSGANAGTVNDGVGTTSFSGIRNLAGGTGADTFALGAGGSLAGSVDGGGVAVNTLNLSALATPTIVLSSASSGSATGVGGGYANITSLVGNGANTTLQGLAGGSTFNVANPDTGTASGATFNAIGSLSGGAGADSFVIGATGSLTGTVNGGGGANSLDLSALGTANVGLTSASSGTASNVAGGYSNVATLVGNGTTSTLTGTGTGSTFTVTANNAGTVNDGVGTTNFSGMPNLVGGAGNDSFVVGAGFTIASLNGSGGTNSLTATAAPGDITLTDALLNRSSGGLTTLAGIGNATLIGDGGNNVLNGSAFTGALGLTLTAGVDTLTGNGNATTLVAASGGSLISVTGANSGSSGTTTFTGVGNLAGGAGADTFSMVGAGTLGGNVTGVGGNDTLDLSARVGIVTINQSGATTGSGVAGTVSGITTIVGNGATTTFIGSNVGQTYAVNAADTVTVGGQTLNGVGNLSAGTGADTFVIGNLGSLSGTLNGGSGAANSLDLSARAAAAFGLSSASSGNASGVAGGYSNVSTLVGNGTSTLTGSNTGSTFTVSAGNAGTVNDGVGTTTFSGVANLVGGTGADGFVVAAAGSLSGTIDGGITGTNSLDLSARGSANFTLASASSGSASGVTGGYSNVTTLAGNAAVSTLTGTNANSSYVVNGANSGNVNGTTTFTGMRNLVGGTGADTFVIGAAGSLAGTVNGGLTGANTLDLSGRGTADFGLTSASAGSASGVAGGYSNVAALVGNGSSTTLTGTNTGSTYNVTGSNAGTVNDGLGVTAFSGVRNLTAGTGADSFVFGAAGSLGGAIDGGTAAANSLNLAALATANFALTSAVSGTATNVGSYANVATLVGNGATSTLTGTNAASTFTVTANNAGTVDAGAGVTSFSGVRNLVGGSGADAFVIGTGFAIGGIDGGAGSNSLTATTGASENLTLADALLGRSLSGNTTLANVTTATVTGGSGSNVINAAGWTAGRTLTVNATAGIDTLVGNGVGTTLLATAAASTFNVTGSDAGTLTQGANVTTFSGTGNLVGGLGNDTFAIQNAGTLTGNIDGGGGANTLDLSNKTSATIVFSSSGNSITGVGIAGSVANIGTVIGNTTNTTLAGSATGQSFVITGNNEITVDGAQVFQGVANLSAGTGADSISGSSFRLAGNIADAGGATALAGTIRTDGSQSYAGAVTAPAVTLIAGGDITAVNPANDFGSVTLSGATIAVRDANAINVVSAALAAGRPLTITAGGPITLNSSITTSADQTFAGNVLLGGNVVLDAGAGRIALQGSVGGGGNNLTLASSAAGANAIGIGGAVSNVGVLNVNGNATLAGNVVSTGTQTYTGTLALTTDTALDAGGGKVDLRGAVDGGGRVLALTSTNIAADAVHLGGAVTNTTQLDVNGRSTVGADVTTSGSQTYTGALTLASNLALSGSAVTLAGTADGAFALAVNAASTRFSGAVGSTTALASLTTDAAGTTQIGGNVRTTGNQTYNDALSLLGDAVLDAGTGKVDLRATVDGGGRVLGLASSNAAADAIRIGGTVSNTAQLGVTGRSTLGANVTTSGSQTYSGALTLGADLVLAGTAVTMGSTTDGAFALAVNAAATRFTGAVGAATALTSLVTDAAGTTQVGGNVRTTGAQTWNDRVALIGDSVMTGTALTFNSSIDGAQALSLTSSAAPTALNGVIGGTVALSSLNVAGPTLMNAGAVTTTGAQSYGGTLQLGADTALNAATIAVTGRVDGAFALDLQNSGTASFGAAIGSTAALTRFTASGGGAVQVAGASVDTTGAQSYSGALQLNGASRLTGSSLTLAGPVSGATDLQLQTNALTGATSLGGTGTLTITSLDPALTIGVVGGAGALQVSQATLNGAAGFTSHVIGRADGSGTITAGALVLRADTTLRTRSGNIDLTGSVDGAFALALESGATTRIAGPVGASTPLRSLATDNDAAAADWNGTTGERTVFDTADGSGAARVVTTGAQTYNDPVTASVALSLNGGAIVATQASNRFDARVSANAASLQLRASTDLTLGDVTLANGGSVTTDGILRFAGALTLNGGTLVLTANATPTAVDLTDPELAGRPVSFGFVPIKEASATIIEEASATLHSAAGSLLVFRSPQGGSLQLDQPGNTLLGTISAVSGSLGDNDLSRFTNASALTLGFIRIASSEIHVAGRPPADGNQGAQAAGIEGDVIKLTADVLTTGSDGLIRARLPFNNVQGSQTSVAGITFVLTPTALATGGGFGSGTGGDLINVQVGGAEGGFITARPRGASGDNAVIFLGGSAEARPFYDLTGKLAEIRIFYNGDAPRTPQEAGALAAVIALIEEARHARFEEAVRTENVSARLRSGVIAEVGAGRPATVGRESIRLPDQCEVKPGTLRCE